MASNNLISLIKRGSLLMGTSMLTVALASACVIKAGSDDDDDDSSSQGSGGSEDGSGGSGDASGGESNAGSPGAGGDTGDAGAPGTGGETTAGGAAGAPAVTAGAAGTPDAGGAAGTPDAGGAAGTPDVGGAAGGPGTAGAAGTPDAGGASGGPTAGGAGGAAGCGAGYVQQDGPVQRTCAAATDDECDGSADVNASLPNGEFGNGFDDDCDGQVDEGCLCPSGTFAGESNGDCWLVPSSQVDDTTNEPVGWCNPVDANGDPTGSANARGSRVCIPDPEGGGDPIWSGECRGAQMPREEDVCSAGDFDCDGVERNAAVDCACVPVQVECPVEAVDTEPYPDPAALDVAIDGASWVVGGAASNWQWTVTGGDCDNILPHPSFAVYDGADTSTAAIIGEEQTGLGANAEQKGIVVTGGPSQIFPAFALSGDYLVNGEFEVDGTPHECTVKVRVRAPGIRAEACWAPMPNDVDLHFARMQASTGSDPRGWFTTGSNGDDNFYANANASWGYTESDGDVCHGWGSRRGTDTSSPCPNPRLDRDNVSCSASMTDPTSSSFCAAENTNIDNPGDGDRFAIGLYAYNISGDVNPHLNVYCNGERRLAMGYDPTIGQNFPVLRVDGYDDSGDFWTAAVVEAVVDGGGTMTDCVVMPVHSETPNAQDGALDYCVDRDPQGGAASGESSWYFISSGAFPNFGTELTVGGVSDLCYH